MKRATLPGRAKHDYSLQKPGLITCLESISNNLRHECGYNVFALHHPSFLDGQADQRHRSGSMSDNPLITGLDGGRASRLRYKK